jgi:hypothetical protein
MLADEYKLIVPFAIQQQSGLDFYYWAFVHIFGFSSLLCICTGLKNHGISAQQQALFNSKTLQ